MGDQPGAVQSSPRGSGPWHVAGFDLSLGRFQVGQRLWVRETWCRAADQDGYYYRADGIDVRAIDTTTHEEVQHAPWRPSIHMPRKASRITLEVTKIRVERLHEITEDDAQAEGVKTSDIQARINGEIGTVHTFGPDAYRQAFRMLWDVINGKPGRQWADKPWVWVITFQRVTP